MTIDVTSNSQYIQLKQSYDQKIDLETQIQGGLDKLNDIGHQMSSLDPHSDQWKQLQDQYNAQMNKLQGLDPDGSVRRAMTGGESAQTLKAEEATALNNLGSVLIGQDAIEQANAAAAQATGNVANKDVDVMTRALMTFAMLGQADDKVVAGQMDVISDNVNKITQLNSLSEAVRNARPDGTDSGKTATISADVVKQLQSLGAEMPMDKMTLSKDGQTYTVSQAGFDTMTNNIQSTESSLTTLNQNKTIDLNKAIDVSQQCTTFESTDLDKWAQLMQKVES